MIVVPEDIYNNLISQQQQMVPPVISQLTNLDQQMQTVLSNPNIPADVKAADFNQLARRYRLMREMELNKPVPVAIQEPVEQVVQVKSNIPVNTITAAIPRPLQNKARILLEHLKQNPSTFQFSDKNELIVDGNKIEGSNLTDLVHEVVRNRAVKHAEGSKEFAQQLTGSNVPKEALGAPQRLKQIISSQSKSKLAMGVSKDSPYAPRASTGKQIDIFGQEEEGKDEEGFFSPANVGIPKVTPPSYKTKRRLRHALGANWEEQILSPHQKRTEDWTALGGK